MVPTWSGPTRAPTAGIRLKAAQFPDFAKQFDAAAPAGIEGFSPPFLASLIEPGIVQIWSGLVVRTAPGWSLLVRAPANLVRNPGYESYEGIVETDRWFGPLFTNIRLTQDPCADRVRRRLPLPAGPAGAAEPVRHRLGQVRSGQRACRVAPRRLGGLPQDGGRSQTSIRIGSVGSTPPSTAAEENRKHQHREPP